MFISYLIVLVGFTASANDIALTPSQLNDCRTREVQRDRDVPQETKTRMLEKCYEAKKAEVRVQNQERAISKLNRNNPGNECIDAVTQGNRFLGFLWKTKRTPSSSELNSCAEKLDQAKQEMERLNADLERLNNQLQSEERELSASAAANLQSAEAARQVRSVVRDEFKEMRLSVLDLLRQSDKGEAQLDRLAQALDNSALGIYMRDRMAAVMSSEAMCKSVSTCASSGKPTAIKGSDLNSSFDNNIRMKADEVSGAAVPRSSPASAQGVNK